VRKSKEPAFLPQGKQDALLRQGKPALRKPLLGELYYGVGEHDDAGLVDFVGG
jgi:hypothetical protein